MERLVALTANLGMYGFDDRRYVTEKVFTDCYADSALDVIGFQEFRDDARDIFERPDLSFVDGLSTTQSDARGTFTTYHAPIAYHAQRLELLAHGAFYLSEDREAGPGWGGAGERSATWAHLHLRGTERSVLVLNTQLDNAEPIARFMGTVAILEFIERYASEKHLSVLMLGDANVSVASTHRRWKKELMREPYTRMEQAGFLDAWLATEPPRAKRPRTFHHFQGPLCGDDEFGTYDPDWIFVRGFRVGNCTLVTDSHGGDWPSDHFWMKAYLDFL